MNSPIQTEILVIGSGLAGAIAAIAAADEVKNVIIITKTSSLKGGNTPKAQGGVELCWINPHPQEVTSCQDYSQEFTDRNRGFLPESKTDI